MSNNYEYVADVGGEIAPPADGTLSQTLHQDDQTKVVLFGFGAGQELSEHTASMPAIMHFLEGEADVTLGPDSVAATPGTWIHMPAKLPHSIRAKSPVKMMLTMLKSGKV